MLLTSTLFHFLFTSNRYNGNERASAKLSNFTGYPFSTSFSSCLAVWFPWKIQCHQFSGNVLALITMFPRFLHVLVVFICLAIYVLPFFLSCSDSVTNFNRRLLLLSSVNELYVVATCFVFVFFLQKIPVHSQLYWAPWFPMISSGLDRCSTMKWGTK